MILAIVGLLLALSTTRARAAFPGDNGSVVFARGGAIVRQAPSGKEKVLAKGVVAAPSYSADGKKIVYLRGSTDFGRAGTTCTS